MKVHNIIGNRSSSHYRDIGIAEWKNFTNINDPYCIAKGCTNKGTEGAHVTKVDSSDHQWYICPFCREHNEAAEDVELEDFADIFLVPLESL